MSLLHERAEHAVTKLLSRAGKDSGLIQKTSIAHACYLPDFLRTKPEPIPRFGRGRGEAADTACEEDRPHRTSPEAGCSCYRDQGRQSHRLSAKSHKRNINGVFHGSLRRHTFPPTQCQSPKLNTNGVRGFVCPVWCQRSGCNANGARSGDTHLGALQGPPPTGVLGERSRMPGAAGRGAKA